MWATEWALIYWHIIYAGFKDLSSNLKDFLWDPVEQATRRQILPSSKHNSVSNLQTSVILTCNTKSLVRHLKMFCCWHKQQSYDDSWERREGVRNWALRTNDLCQTTLILFFSFHLDTFDCTMHTAEPTSSGFPHQEQ